MIGSTDIKNFTGTNTKVQLSDRMLSNIAGSDIAMPPENYSQLPVKVLQFGTGVLLRGLPDYLIDEANRAGVFNGRVVVVKSTNTNNTDGFTKQNNLYTILTRGIKDKQPVDEAVINSSISHVLSAGSEWEAILKEAENPHLSIIISNTTEVGIQLVKEDISQKPPVSYPAKLLAVLYHRYKTFSGSAGSGLVIIPTELLPNNATILKSILMELLAFNNLSKGFENWLNENNYFCNSLVDRIVPGRPDSEELDRFEEKSGYHDELLIVAEPYILWAIEGDEKVKAILSFEQINEGVIVVPDIELHRELKLRLLNGTHTLSCALAIAMGFDVVNTATNDPQFAAFLQSLMFEIRSGMPYKADTQIAEEFSERVLDRFRNPYIQHQWIAIAQQYTTKIISRVLPVLKEYYKLYNQVPVHIAKGFAAYLLLISKLKKDNGEYYIAYKKSMHLFKDDKVGLLVEKRDTGESSGFAFEALNCREVWGEDLVQLPGFAHAVQHYLDTLAKDEVTTAKK